MKSDYNSSIFQEVSSVAETTAMVIKILICLFLSTRGLKGLGGVSKVVAQLA